MIYTRNKVVSQRKIFQRQVIPIVFIFVHRLTDKLNRCLSECPWPRSRSLPATPNGPTTRRPECATGTVRGASNWRLHAKAYRGRGRRCGGRPVADGRGDGGGQHAHVHHHQLQLLRPHRRRRPSTIHARWPRSVRPSVLPSERERSIWMWSASCGRPSDVPEPPVSDAVTFYASRVHTLNRVIASYCASLPPRRRPLRRRRRKESAPASGPDASKSGRARARYR